VSVLPGRRLGVAVAAVCLIGAAWAGGPADRAVPGLRRAPNMPDGAPAVEVHDAAGRVVRRIECINSGWYDADAMAARLLGAPAIMAAVLRKNGAIGDDDLGPGKFDCVVTDAQPVAPKRVSAPAPRSAAGDRSGHHA